MSTMKTAVVSTAFGLLAATRAGVLAQKKYDPGAADTEINIATSCPTRTGFRLRLIGQEPKRPTSKKVKAEGGINGRKINVISYDDAYSRRDGGTGRKAGPKR